MTSDQLARALESFRIQQAQFAAQALHAGWSVEFGGPVEDFKDLAATYSVRLTGLRAKSALHSRQLSESVEEFFSGYKKTHSILRPHTIGNVAVILEPSRKQILTVVLVNILY